MWTTAGTRKKFPLKVQDFMLDTNGQRRRRQSAKEQEAIFWLFAEAHNENEARKRNA